MQEVVVSIIGVAGTLSAIFFAYLSFRRNDKKDAVRDAKTEGTLLSDVGYIKSSINRMEQKLDKVENNYNILLNRLTRVEESYVSLSQRFEEHISLGG